MSALALLLVAAALAAPASGAPPEDPEPAPAIGIDEYRDALEAIATALEDADLPEARRQARALRGARVAAEGGLAFEADPTVLVPVAEAVDASEAVRARARVRRVIESLGAPPPLSGSADVSLLERLAREEAARRPSAGGKVDAQVPLRAPSLPERVQGWLLAASDALADLLARLWRWLLRFRPRTEQGEPLRTAGLVTLLVSVLVFVLAIAAVWALRRRGAPAIAEVSVEEMSARDEDPLSREAADWERYASELARGGRLREAIRAWYHAVLVTLFRSGRLHHQRGRTNWEYVAALGPEVPWRPTFAELTRSFDREWYGRETSVAEALRECTTLAREVLRSVRGESAE